MYNTLNGATAFGHLKDPQLEFFSSVGNLRNSNPAPVFDAAFASSPLLALRTVFYLRNRNGVGEREVFRKLIKHLAIKHTDTMRKNIPLIPELGRWDDLYALVGTPLEYHAFAFMYQQLIDDCANMGKKKNISLLAKWLKSENASSPVTKALGRRTRENFHLSARNYRKVLSTMRAYLNVVERKISVAGPLDIDYEKLPGQALKKYRKAFKNRDLLGFAAYIQKVVDKKAKMNTSTIMPYEILRDMGLQHAYRENFSLANPLTELQVMWDNLPNYVDLPASAIVMADTSASMSGLPIEIALSLGIYFAERNQGVFNNMLLTFSKTPTLVELKGKTLQEKVACIPAIVSNTDLFRGFKLLLNVAVQKEIPQEEMPKALIVISDMEIDPPDSKDYTLLEALRKEYAKAGYDMPKLILWNVAQGERTTFLSQEDENVIFLSGSSASVCKTAIDSITKTAYDTMLDVLTSSAYQKVTL